MMNIDSNEHHQWMDEKRGREEKKIFGLGITEGVFWVAVIIIFGILEAISLGLTTIWFAFGALIAWIASMLGVPLPMQIFLFILTSGVLLYFTRPLAQKFLKIGHTKTNAQSLIGQHARVIEKINPIEGKGQVKVAGQIWSAKSLDETIIEAEQTVEVLDIQGVKLIVRTINK